MSLAFVIAGAVAFVLAAAMLAHFAAGPVARARVERFARRQHLTITPWNGEHVIRYLATVRRWRVAGLLGGIGVSILRFLPDELRFDAVTIFAGWFLGALVAEVRVVHLAHGPRRAAALRPRRPRAYIGRAAWALVPAAAIVSVLVAVATAWAAATGHAQPDWTAVSWLVVSLAVAAAVRAIQWHVLRRPQPLAEADVIAADDAIRSRALHVLSGGGLALVFFCVSVQAVAAHPLDPAVATDIGVISTLAVFAAAAVGWLVAIAPWQQPAAVPATAGSTT